MAGHRLARTRSRLTTNHRMLIWERATRVRTVLSKNPPMAILSKQKHNTKPKILSSAMSKSLQKMTFRVRIRLKSKKRKVPSKPEKIMVQQKTILVNLISDIIRSSKIVIMIQITGGLRVATQISPICRYKAISLLLAKPLWQQIVATLSLSRWLNNMERLSLLQTNLRLSKAQPWSSTKETLNCNSNNKPGSLERGQELFTTLSMACGLPPTPDSNCKNTSRR